MILRKEETSYNEAIADMLMDVASKIKTGEIVPIHFSRDIGGNESFLHPVSPGNKLVKTLTTHEDYSITLDYRIPNTCLNY